MTHDRGQAILSDFRSLPLPVKMWAAAEVQEEASARENDGQPIAYSNLWSADDLRVHADHWDAEDKAAAEREADVVIVAGKLSQVDHATRINTHYREYARAVLDALPELGYVKEKK